MNYYNEIDPKAAAWLQELIAEGHLPYGEVDQRSITDVSPTDLSGFVQCHFFAGIGGWSLALALAGWSADRPVWTGSCPCQPFSSAGKQMGRKDPRHLWPAFRRLINRCRPPVVFGEQVASKDGRKWLAGVFANLETMGYAPAGADLCAAGIGAPHIRQRLWWVAHSEGQRWHRSPGVPQPAGRKLAQAGGATGRLVNTHLSDQHERPSGGEQPLHQLGGEPRRMGNANGEHPRRDSRAGGREEDRSRLRSGSDEPCPSSPVGGMAHSGGEGSSELRRGRNEPAGPSSPSRPWDSFDLIPCRDGKARRVEPGTFPLVARLPAGVVPSGDYGTPEFGKASSEGRMMRLRGYGNSIVPQLAAEFIQSYIEATHEDLH